MGRAVNALNGPLGSAETKVGLQICKAEQRVLAEYKAGCCGEIFQKRRRQFCLSSLCEHCSHPDGDTLS